MTEIEILKMLKFIFRTRIILLCLLIYVIAGVITYYLKSRKVELDNIYLKYQYCNFKIIHIFLFLSILESSCLIHKFKHYEIIAFITTKET